jgi:hypothetical protein
MATLSVEGPLVVEQAAAHNVCNWAQSCHSAFVWKPEDKAF